MCAPLAVLVGVTEEPRSGRFDQPIAYPNPFENDTRVQFSLVKAGDVNVAVYDVAGRMRRTLQSGRMEEGVHYVAWDGMDSDGLRARAGIYFLKVRSGAQIVSAKVVRVK